jgi:hypothetical protein
VVTASTTIAARTLAQEVVDELELVRESDWIE